MAQIWEYIKIALMNIRSNKGRSILTMLGIIIGISSVIMIISIGNGIKGGINDELNSMAGVQSEPGRLVFVRLWVPERAPSCSSFCPNLLLLPC